MALSRCALCLLVLLALASVCAASVPRVISAAPTAPAHKGGHRQSSASSGGGHPIAVKLGGVVGHVAAEFVSFTQDGTQLTNNGTGWIYDFNFHSDALVNIFKYMQPSILRFGGTFNDYVTYDFGVDGVASVGPTNWDAMAVQLSTFKDFFWFLDAAGLPLLWGLNGRQRKSFTSPWDPTNSLQVIKLKHALDHGLAPGMKNPKWFGFELGNEPDMYLPKWQAWSPPGLRTITTRKEVSNPKQLAKDFATLRKLVDSEKPCEHRCIVVGPDVANPNQGDFMTQFNRAITPTDIDAITTHHYFLPKSGRKKFGESAAGDTKWATNPKLMELLEQWISRMQQVQSVNPKLKRTPMWLGETSSFGNGGSPHLGQKFGAGFFWLPKLGIAAKMGVSMVFRQSLYLTNQPWTDDFPLKSNRALAPPKWVHSLVTNDGTPTPDMFISILHKQLAGTTVLDASKIAVPTRVLLYGHCTRTNGKSDVHPGGRAVPKGAVTLIYINQNSHAVSLGLSSYHGGRWEYALTSGGHGSAVNLMTNPDIRLNGRVLRMKGDAVPSLAGREVQSNAEAFVAAPLSYGFIVLPGAGHAEC